MGEEMHGPGHAIRQAALAAGWSHRHRDVSGGWLRPTVFGAVDGLVTNASLIAGLGGGGVPARAVILTGVAALVAGAFSMGTGEYVSVTNQNELVHAEVSTERAMLARFPAAEQAELAETFAGYGADQETAARMAAAVSADPDTALRVHTREELGVDPFELPSALDLRPPPLRGHHPPPLRHPRLRLHRRQAEVDVAGSLHHPLPLHHPLAVLPVPAFAHVGLKHRCRRLLDLQEERVMLVASLEQNDERPGPDAADADDLARRVHDLEALQQLTPVVWQGGPVGAELLIDRRHDLSGDSP